MKTVDSPTPGKIFTFYSYKGGTGRSMALANFACWLGRRRPPSPRVLVVDWDLEAPGLQRYFADKAELPENVSRPGLINYFEAMRERLGREPGLYERLSSGEGGARLGDEFPLGEYLVREVAPGVDLIKAGRLDADYARQVSEFDWVDFYGKYGDMFRAFRGQLTSDYDYCLIDSRTGFNDASGICTMLMPEKLVLVFTPNRQNLSGVLDIAARALDYRRAADDYRPLAVFPLPSRIENAEHELKQKWRRQYQQEFEAALRNLYQLDGCDLTAYFDEVLLPHVSFYAYGEELALLRERSDALSLSRAYENFFERLDGVEFAWDGPGAKEAEEAKDAATPPTPIMPPPEQPASDVYISYSHIDNSTLAGWTQGWVDAFHEALQLRLAQLFGSEVRIWRDEKIVGADSFHDTVVHQLAQASVFVAIVSPPYLGSAWCRKELEVFRQQAEKQGGLVVNGRSRIVPVFRTPVPRESLPEWLSRVTGFDFYEIDEQGRPREFPYNPGPNRDFKFLEKINDLAYDIRELISRGLPGPAPESPEGVYLAETTSGLRHERERVKRELQQYGYHVLPDAELPGEAGAFEAAARDLLARCRLSVHLIGDSDGATLEGSGWHSAERLQVELAAERAAGDPSFSRVIWVPAGLQPRSARKGRFLADLEAGITLRDEFLRTGIEDLKTRILEKLKSRVPAAAAAPAPGVASVYLMYDDRDRVDIAPLEDYLFQQGFEVIPPLFEGDSADAAQYHRENLMNCDAALLYYGRANQAWLRSRLWDLQKAQGWGRRTPMRAKAVYVAGPPTSEKQRFRTHEVPVVIQNFHGFTPEALQPFIRAMQAAH